MSGQLMLRAEYNQVLAAKSLVSLCCFQRRPRRLLATSDMWPWTVHILISFKYSLLTVHILKCLSCLIVLDILNVAIPNQFKSIRPRSTRYWPYYIGAVSPSQNISDITHFHIDWTNTNQAALGERQSAARRSSIDSPLEVQGFLIILQVRPIGEPCLVSLKVSGFRFSPNTVGSTFWKEVVIQSPPEEVF